jgi:hypothetical protein
MSNDPTSLDRLHDIIAPAPVPWWPPAPAWYWVLGCAAFVVLVLAAHGILRWQRNRYRREALHEWHALSAKLGDPGTRLFALTGLAVLLKRVALTAFPREEVAALTGPGWQSFLQRTAASPNFVAQTAGLIESVAYGTATANDVDETKAREAAALVHGWILNHRTNECR